MTYEINYFLIPEERLGTLIDYGFKELHELEKNIREDWIKNNKCECVRHLSNGKVLRCEHIKKEKDKITKEARERLRKKCFVSQFRSLIKTKSS